MININLQTLILQLTPPVQRTVEVIAGIKAKFAPLETLQTAFFTFFDKIDYETTWNGQVCMLEELLNNEFDNVTRGIYITDAQNIDKLFLFNKAENNEDTTLFNLSEGEDPFYFFNTTEVSQYHFIVNVPAIVVFNEDLLKFYVNKYKLTGKRWKIEII